MSESHGDHLEVLTDAEREAIERPGLKQRARALVAATELATKLGLSEDTHSVLLSHLRELDKRDAKLARETLGNMNELLTMLSVDVREPSDNVTQSDASISEAVEPIRIKVAGDELLAQVDGLIAEDEPKSVFETELDFRKVRSFYQAIVRKTEHESLVVPSTAAEVDKEELVGLIALYAANHTMPKVAAKQVETLLGGFQSDDVIDSYGNGVRFTASNGIAKLLDGLGGAQGDAEPAAAKPGVIEPIVSVQELVQISPKALVEEALTDLIEHEGHESVYKIERVERFLDQLRDKMVDLNITAEDFTHETLKQLASIYAKAVNAGPETIATNIACTWGWLAGVDMEDLRHMRSKTKADASSQDVHNSRASFVQGLSKGWRHGLRPAFEEAEDFPVELHVVEADPEQVPEPALAPAVEETIADIEASERYERPIDEEPQHVQIAKAYIEQLSLTVNPRAFEELLNPKTRSDVSTPAKTVVLEILRQRVGEISSDGQIFNELDITPRAKAALRRMLGMGFEKHGRPEERAPEALREQLRNIDFFHKEAYTQDLYAALDALLEVLAKPGEKEVVPKPLQVMFDSGDARLA